MEQIVKSYFGIYLLLLFMTIQLGVISMGMKNLEAQNCMHLAVCELESCGLEAEIIDSLCREMEARGYHLVVEVIEGRRGTFGKIKLTYETGIAYLGLSVEKTLEGAARGSNPKLNTEEGE